MTITEIATLFIDYFWNCHTSLMISSELALQYVLWSLLALLQKSYNLLLKLLRKSYYYCWNCNKIHVKYLQLELLYKFCIYCSKFYTVSLIIVKQV